MSASGLIAPSSGAILVDGTDITGKRTYQFARAGIAHAPEGRSVFASLTVEENLTLSFRRVLGREGRASATSTRAYELFPVLGRRRTQQAGTLSGGEQRMLSLARVLVEVPKLLIADELSLGLAPIIVDELYESLERLRAGGTALLIVEQQVNARPRPVRPCGRARPRRRLLDRSFRRGGRHRRPGVPALDLSSRGSPDAAPASPRASSAESSGPPPRRSRGGLVAPWATVAAGRFVARSGGFGAPALDWVTQASGKT